MNFFVSKKTRVRSVRRVWEEGFRIDHSPLGSVILITSKETRAGQAWTSNSQRVRQRKESLQYSLRLVNCEIVCGSWPTKEFPSKYRYLSLSRTPTKGAIVPENLLWLSPSNLTLVELRAPNGISPLNFAILGIDELSELEFPFLQDDCNLNLKQFPYLVVHNNKCFEPVE